MTREPGRGRGPVPIVTASGTAVTITDDPAAVDLEAAWRFLSTEAYWARWRTREDVERQVAASWRVVSAHADGRMVGFARAISDGVAVAYLADVYVEASVRGGGIARAMLALMIEDGPDADFRWMLHTEDAHGLYRSFGFTEPTDRYLERPPRR